MLAVVIATILGLVQAGSVPKIGLGQDVDITTANYNAVVGDGAPLPNTALLCGATILREDYALTTATCVGNTPTDQLSVVAGFSQKGVPLAGTQQVTLRRVTKHPEYNVGADGFAHPNNDIALLQFSTNLIFGAEVGAIAIAAGDPPIGTPCNVYGYGAPGTERILSMTVMDTIAKVVCEAEVGALSPDVECGEGPGTVCVWDEGSPITCLGQLGGISIGAPLNDCNLDVPSVAVNAAFHKAWIETVMG